MIIRGLKHALLLIIIAQLVGGAGYPALSYALPPPDGEENNRYETPALKNTWNEIENFSFDQHPRNTPDPRFLSRQYRKTKNREYHLSNPLVSVDIMSPDFARVGLRINPSNQFLNFIYQRRGEEIVHEIQGPKIAHFTVDREIIQLITTDHRMYAIDLEIARKVVFNAPVPLTYLTNIDPQIPLTKIKIVFLTRGVRPPDTIASYAVVPTGPSSEQFYSAGDLMIYSDDENGLRTLHGLYSRRVTYYWISADNGDLARIGAILRPQGISRDFFLENSSAPGRTTQTQLSILQGESQLNAMSVDPLSRNAILSMVALKEDQPARLHAQSNALRRRADEQRDVFTQSEWREFFNGPLMKNIQVDPNQTIEENNRILQQSWQRAAQAYVNQVKAEKSKILQFIDQYSLKMMGGIIAASAGVFSFTALGLDGTFGEWGVHFTNRLIDAHLLPAIMRDQSYRMPVILSTIGLMSFLPFSLLLGGLYGKFINQGALRGFVTFGIRVASVFQYPFIEKTIHTLQASGKFVRKNVINRIKNAVGIQTTDPLSARQEFINAVRAKSDSWLLAHIIVAERYGIDLSTLMTAEDQGTEIVIRALRSDLNQSSEFMKAHSLVARDLMFSLADLYNDRELKDLSQMDRDELNRNLELARKTARELLDSGNERVSTNLRVLRARWREAANGVFNYLASFGSGEYRFFREVTPNDFSTSLAFRQYAIDYPMAVPLEASWGERADLSKPQYLAAQSGEFLETNPAHLADMGEQVIIYWFRESATTVQVYQQNAPLKDTNYRAIEEITQAGVENPEGFWRALKRWGAAAFNLGDANYGGLAVKTMWKRINALQMAATMSLLCRVFIGGNSLGFSALGYFYTFLWGFFVYAWPWLLVSRGNQMVEAVVEENAAALKDAKTKIAQGIRLNDAEMANQGMSSLLALYEKTRENGTHSEIVDIVKKVEQYLKIPAKEKIRLDGVTQPYIKVLIDLEKAYQSQDPGAITKAYDDLKQLYRNGGEGAAVENLDPQRLLEYALKHPPVYNVPNQTLLEITTLFVGAIPTTILATKLYAESYDPAHLTPQVFIMSGIEVTLLYGVLYGGQIAINRWGPSITQAVRNFLSPMSNFCEILRGWNAPDRGPIDQH